MSHSLKEIEQPIKKELQLFQEQFKDFMKSKIFILDHILRYILKQKSKRIRPIIVLLSAKLYGGINEKTYRSAMLVELLHTATLIHDDVIDNAEYRRGFFSINKVWKNKIAILVGDYLLSQGLLISVKNQDFRQLQILSVAVEEMSKGELLQLKKSRLLNFSEDMYFCIIKKKTASLISCCCEIGAISVNTDECQVQKIKEMGEIMGIIFQLKDDLLDFEKKSTTGKSFASDLKENKFTLPLIHVLGQLSWLQRQRMITMANSKNLKQKKINQLIDLIKERKGIEYTIQVMNKYYERGLELLYQLPESEVKLSFEKLFTYLITRKK